MGSGLPLVRLCGFLGVLLACCAGPPERPEFTRLFNGRDLSGWVNVNGGPQTWTVRDGTIVCSGKPAGVLRTERMYENFVFEMEWRHMVPGGNAGLFVWSDALPARGEPFTRSIEVQVMDGRETPNTTSHGDVFAIHGARMTPARPHPAGWARCLPSEKRSRRSPDWNHYRVTCIDGHLALAVNGKEVSGGSEVEPRKGYLCLESEGSEVHFRNLRILELPSTPSVGPERAAQEDRGFRSLFNGVDLSGWREDPDHAGHWAAKDWILDYDGKGDHLWSVEEFGDFELIADWRWSGPPVKKAVPVILPSGEYETDEKGNRRTVEVDEAGDSGIYLRGNDKSQVNIWCWPIGSGEVYGYRTDAKMPAEVRAGVTPKVSADAPLGEWNRFHVRMVGDRLTVILNGKRVIEDAQLPGVPARGRIALQHHGSPIQFANLFVREIR
jgi:3-keto-disaccharide hydrolase